ncbi:MAG: MarR family transcriptional regulator [Oscillospiraceae bacterium]|nr:MarR family transcriptional regulator [Oscillospiraceae bacterium]
MNYDKLKLKNQLCFPLYACSKEVVRRYKPFLDELDLTYTQYITMMVMWEQKIITVKELGKFLYLDSGTLTPVLMKLENKGYIERIKNRIDGRVLDLKLTHTGEELMEKAVNIPEQIVKCVPLDEADANKLYEILYHILDSR